MACRIRQARPADAPLLPGIEASAARLFLSVPGLAWLAAEPPSPAGAYLPAIQAGTVWVAETAERHPVGFLAAEAAAGDLHIREVSVHADHQGRGLGRRLIETALTHARALGFERLTLTTFRDVPWNAPFYARLGFRMLPADRLAPRLIAVLQREADHGLPADRRCAMAYPLGGTPG